MMLVEEEKYTYERNRVEICEKTYFMWAFGKLDT